MAQALMAHTTVVSGFVDSLQEPRTPYISPNRLSKALGVPVTGLAELTGVHLTASIPLRCVVVRQFVDNRTSSMKTFAKDKSASSQQPQKGEKREFANTRPSVTMLID